MTTNITVNCNPFKSGAGKQLEVVVETWDNGVLQHTTHADYGHTLNNICCFEGREIRITEREKQE